MRTLIAVTDPFIKTEHGLLDAPVSAGTNVTLTLVNNDGLSNQDYLVIGYEGNELCELVQVNQAVTAGTSVRVSTLKFDHQKGEPVTRRTSLISALFKDVGVLPGCSLINRRILLAKSLVDRV